MLKPIVLAVKASQLAIANEMASQPHFYAAIM
jgi:hypothetical protein